MKIHIDDIHEGGMQLNLDSGSAPWLKQLFIDVFGADKFQDEDLGRADLELFKNGRDVTIIGGVVLKFHPACDRCLKVFGKQEQIPIHQIVAPYYEGAKTNKGKEKSNVEDEDIGYYKNDEIELGNIIKEYVILAQGMVNLCSSECKGLCQKCGKNLNTGPCKCRQTKEKKGSPFAILKKRK